MPLEEIPPGDNTIPQVANQPGVDEIPPGAIPPGDYTKRLTKIPAGVHVGAMSPLLEHVNKYEEIGKGDLFGNNPGHKKDKSGQTGR